jgi:ketosteroid isomerase-like protein
MNKPTVLASTLILFMSGWAAASQDPLKEVEALEKARFKAQIAMDLPTLRPMLADDLYYCHSSGVCQNKAEFIGFVTSGTNKYVAMDVISMKPRLVGSAVVVNGKLDIRVISDGKEQHFQGIYTDVYAKRDGRWQLVTWQSTRLP